MPPSDAELQSTRRILYLSHPEVVIDPAVAVPEWGLSDVGRARLSRALASGWPGPGWDIFSSTEVKAAQSAEMIARSLGSTFASAAGLAEVDRSSTGYLPHDLHEEQVNALFRYPGQSAGGWETASDALSRNINTLQSIMSCSCGDILLVGHGGVGTFLWCHAADLPISRSFDQPSAGCVWEVAVNSAGHIPIHPWRSLEEVAALHTSPTPC